MPATSRPSPLSALRPWASVGFALFGTLLLPACSKDGKAAAPSTPPASAPPPATAIPANASPAERIILQARAALGSESNLTGVTTLELTGTVSDSKNQLVGQLAIMFKKPARMRSEIQTPNLHMIQGSDGVAGWEFDTDKDNHKKNAVMPSKDEQQNIFETLENLYFFRGSEHVTGASVTVDGQMDYRGIACSKLTFHYPGDVTYVRYFNRATGKLVSTILEPTGVEFIEEGEYLAGGIVFPKSLRQYSKDGQLTQTINFDKVIVNQPLDDRLFEQPSLIASFAAPTASANSAAAGSKPAGSPAAPVPTIGTAPRAIPAAPKPN